jgi:Tfp pilus assembly protein PilO
MTSFLDRLNLRPFEKRLVVVVAVVLFIVLNAWFVVPHFSDLARAQERKAQAQKKLQNWQVEVDQLPKYRTAINSLIGGTAEVPPEDQHNQFSEKILQQQIESGVQGQGGGRNPTIRTNEFFLELSKNISVVSEEPQLVDFLYKLGGSESLIRVRGLTLKPKDPNARHQLQADITLVASYQKNPAKKPAPATKTSTAKSKS